MTEPETARPHCSVCRVDMWLIHISGAPGRRSYKFECKVCGAQQVVAEDGDAKRCGDRQ